MMKQLMSSFMRLGYARARAFTFHQEARDFTNANSIYMYEGGRAHALELLSGNQTPPTPRASIRSIA